MVHLDVVRACNTALLKSQPFVAVFFGGTAGIGECGVRSLASTHGSEGKGLRLYIVGRNKAAAERTIAHCLEISPTGTFQFVQAKDLSLMRDVDRVCAEIISEERKANGEKAKIDFLCLSQGFLSFKSRRDTNEGLDRVMGITYYGRMRCIVQLLPLLLAAPRPAHVVTVFNPTFEGKVQPNDLGLRDPKNFGFTYGASHMTLMTTFYLENLANRYPEKLALIHYYPGIVMTNLIDNGVLPFYARWLWKFFIGPICSFWQVPFGECGERVLFHASGRFPARSEKETEAVKKVGQVDVAVAVGSDGKVGSGAYKTTWNGESILSGKPYENAARLGLYEKVWEHTTTAFSEIEAGRVFTG